MKKIYIASDHAGFLLKSTIIQHLKNQNYDVADFGPQSNISCDYPNSAQVVAKAVLADENSFGILICGSGIGMSMAANRFNGIRAALASCEFHARASRQHNNANIICIGERVSGQGLALNMVDIFLETEFEGGRHQKRIDLFD